MLSHHDSYRRHIYKIVKNKRNPLKDEIYTDLEIYKSVVEANK